MTKAEAWVAMSPHWPNRPTEQRTEDHKSVANTIANIYISNDGQWRLVCYSSHGDSILWQAVHNAEVSKPRYQWQLASRSIVNNRDANVEFEYDTILPTLTYNS